MNEWLPYLVYLIASLSSVIAFSFKSIYILRGLTIFSSLGFAVYYSFFQVQPMWLDISSESIVVIVNIIMLLVLMNRERKVSFSAEEKEIHEGIFTNLSAFEFFKLIRSAKWADHKKGEKLIRTGERVPEVHLIYTGCLGVDISDQDTIFLKDGYFVGERSFMTGERANADVIALECTRTLSWNQVQLRDLLQRNPSMHKSFSEILSKDISKKLYG